MMTSDYPGHEINVSNKGTLKEVFQNLINDSTMQAFRAELAFQATFQKLICAICCAICYISSSHAL